jgi:hypothetical protein
MKASPRRRDRPGGSGATARSTPRSTACPAHPMSACGCRPAAARRRRGARRPGGEELSSRAVAGAFEHHPAANRGGVAQHPPPLPPGARRTVRGPGPGVRHRRFHHHPAARHPRQRLRRRHHPDPAGEQHRRPQGLCASRGLEPHFSTVPKATAGLEQVSGATATTGNPRFSFAYVFCSVSRIQSAIDVERLLGRCCACPTYSAARRTP